MWCGLVSINPLACDWCLEELLYAVCCSVQCTGQVKQVQNSADCSGYQDSNPLISVTAWLHTVRWCMIIYSSARSCLVAPYLHKTTLHTTTSHPPDDCGYSLRASIAAMPHDQWHEERQLNMFLCKKRAQQPQANRFMLHSRSWTLLLLWHVYIHSTVIHSHACALAAIDADHLSISPSVQSYCG